MLLVPVDVFTVRDGVLRIDMTGQCNWTTLFDIISMTVEALPLRVEQHEQHDSELLLESSVQAIAGVVTQVALHHAVVGDARTAS